MLSRKKNKQNEQLKRLKRERLILFKCVLFLPKPQMICKMLKMTTIKVISKILPAVLAIISQ